MSTMLRTAAMTLLSKTLQKFLYKYLLDVDVEGVAMPSLMDVDGQSGWGVRLCNVRLREGVELMTLPGKRQAKKRKRKGEPVPVDNETKQQSEDDTGAEQAVSDDAAELSTCPSTPRGNNENDGLPLDQRIDPDLSEVESNPGSRPPTPDMNVSKRSVLGCFMRHPAPNAAGKQKEDENDDVETPSAPRSRGLTQDEIDHLVRQNSTFEEFSKETKDLQHEEKVDETATSTKDEVDVNKDEAGFVLFEDQDMMLRLGNGGRIGTLDVRLVGKELHVSVEDAFLVLEACPKPEADDGNDSSGDASATDDVSINADALKGKQPASKKKEPSKTVAERVLENSVIARAFSALPHLFLRDCRVQIILREERPTTVDEADPIIADEDSVVEIGVELLSVTSGEDILAHFRMDEELAAGEGASADNAYASQVSSYENTDLNEYLVKRIRTGRGPEGGIWMKVFPPGTIGKIEPQLAGKTSGTDRWSHQVWMSTTQFCFFRCSGLDVRARVYLGQHEDISKDDWAYYDEFSIDTMLYSVDYIAPGTSPPLPPLEHGASTVSMEETNPRSLALVYQTDGNGVQSSQINSTFHRVARGLIPSLCKGNHLPCENCSHCWEADGYSQATEAKTMDGKTPLPGVVFNISLKDPLEINVDRSGLEVLGSLQQLLHDESKDAGSPKPQEPEPPNNEEGPSQSRATKALSSLRDRWARKEDKETVSDAFPSYMQPENIEIVGLHLSKVLLRIHVMRDSGACDSGFSFRYWDTVTRCVTLDMQKLSSEDKSYNDIRFDVGEFTMTEYRGIECTRLVSVGLPYSEASDDTDSISASSHSVKYSPNKVSWPSTASELLNIQPPIETAHYETRERHGLQVRYMSLAPAGNSSSGQARSQLNLRIGVLAVNMPYTVTSDIFTIMNESKSCLFGPPKEIQDEAKTQTTDSDPSSSLNFLMKYKIQIDGAAINLFPVINVRLPLTEFQGDRSSESGLLLETLLQHVTMEYGSRQPSVERPSQLSVAQIAKLPETVRMRVLMFLNDLGPLERALGLKRESNSFLRFAAVNKGLVKHAKRAAKAALKLQKRKARHIESSTSTSRRQQILTELLKLDDSALDELWHTHHKSTRRHKRSVSTSGKL